MKKLFPRLLAAAAATACLGVSHATVLTFDGLAESPFAPNMPFVGDGDEFYESGHYLYAFSNDAGSQPGDLVGAIIDGTEAGDTCLGLVCPTDNSTSFYALLNDGVLVVGRNDGNPLKMLGLSASFIAASGDVVPTTAGALRAQGITPGGASLTSTVFLPGPVGGQYSFSDYSFSDAFTSTEFAYVYLFGFACDATGNCSAFTTNKAQFAIDNISVVPEPAQWLLMGLGLAALGAVVRRRQPAA
jgi:hypothetical protein